MGWISFRDSDDFGNRVAPFCRHEVLAQVKFSLNSRVSSILACTEQFCLHFTLMNHGNDKSCREMICGLCVM